MNSNTRRKFIRNTALGVFALSAGAFAIDKNRKQFNLAQLFKGGVRFTDVENLLVNDFPQIFNDVVLIKVNCKSQDNLHSSAAEDFLQNINQLKSKHGDLQINTTISKSFDVAHYNYQKYIQLLKIELKNMVEFVERNNLETTKEVNLFITSDIGRNNYFNELNEIEELSGLDHDGYGSDETFALFYSNSKKIKAGNFSDKIILQENLFSYFEQIIGNSNVSKLNSDKDIFEIMT